MGAPQVILICLISIGLFVDADKHGESKSDLEYNFFSSLIINAIILAILWWGGFFG